jgi:hypothetical protein
VGRSAPQARSDPSSCGRRRLLRGRRPRVNPVPRCARGQGLPVFSAGRQRMTTLRRCTIAAHRQSRTNLDGHEFCCAARSAPNKSKHSKRQGRVRREWSRQLQYLATMVMGCALAAGSFALMRVVIAVAPGRDDGCHCARCRSEIDRGARPADRGLRTSPARAHGIAATSTRFSPARCSGCAGIATSRRPGPKRAESIAALTIGSARMGCRLIGGIPRSGDAQPRPPAPSRSARHQSRRSPRAWRA